MASSHFQGLTMGAVKFLGASDVEIHYWDKIIYCLSKMFRSGFLKRGIAGVLFALFGFLSIQFDLMSTPALSINQSPSLSITNSNLSGLGGTDLTPTSASSPMTLVFSVTETAATNSVVLTQWSCYCSLGNASSNWPSNLACSIKFSDPGSSNATSSTGGGYVTLNSSQQKICAGSGNGNRIILQCLLSNLSLANCPPTTSTATLPIIVTLNSS